MIVPGDIRQFQAMRVINPDLTHLYNRVGYVSGYSVQDGWVRLSFKGDNYILNFHEVEFAGVAQGKEQLPPK